MKREKGFSNPLVLVVEDRATIRGLVVEVLRMHGCRALSAANGREGFEIWRERSSEIDLVITDNEMPEMTGEQMVLKILEAKPAARVLFFASTAIEGPALRKLPFLNKPASINAIWRAVELLLPTA